MNNVTVLYPASKFNLSSLEEDTDYNITITTSTTKGEEYTSEHVIGRTLRDGKPLTLIFLQYYKILNTLFSFY